MDINATIIGQFITFAILVWFTMKYVWPPITKAMHEREKKIAAGIEASERSKRELEQAERKALTIIQNAKMEATQIVEHANKRSQMMVDEAKDNARIEGKRIVDLAHGDIVREVAQAKEVLRKQLASLAIAGAEKIIQRNLDAATQTALLNEIVSEI